MATHSLTPIALISRLTCVISQPTAREIAHSHPTEPTIKNHHVWIVTRGSVFRLELVSFGGETMPEASSRSGVHTSLPKQGKQKIFLLQRTSKRKSNDDADSVRRAPPKFFLRIQELTWEEGELGASLPPRHKNSIAAIITRRVLVHFVISLGNE